MSGCSSFPRMTALAAGSSKSRVSVIAFRSQYTGISFWCSRSYSHCRSPRSGCDCSRCCNCCFFRILADGACARVKGRIQGVEVVGIQMILNDPQGFAEALEVHDLPGPQETDRIAVPDL